MDNEVNYERWRHTSQEVIAKRRLINCNKKNDKNLIVSKRAPCLQIGSFPIYKFCFYRRVVSFSHLASLIPNGVAKILLIWFVFLVVELYPGVPLISVDETFCHCYGAVKSDNKVRVNWTIMQNKCNFE